MCAINTNGVRGRSLRNFFYMKIYHTKVSLHENFQIYGNSEKSSKWQHNHNHFKVEYAAELNDFINFLCVDALWVISVLFKHAFSIWGEGEEGAADSAFCGLDWTIHCQFKLSLMYFLIMHEMTIIVHNLFGKIYRRNDWSVPCQHRQYKSMIVCFHRMNFHSCHWLWEYFYDKKERVWKFQWLGRVERINMSFFGFF